MGDKPKPTSPFERELIDPQPAVGFFSCTRDTAGCPALFESAGSGVCIPTDAYTGPCASAADFGSMSLSAMSRWADTCQTTWACSSCSKTDSSCPFGWTRNVQKSGFVCEPGVMYVGPCDASDIAGFTTGELETWASQCGAVWPCK